jgi:hypothetical protein
VIETKPVAPKPLPQKMPPSKTFVKHYSSSSEEEKQPPKPVPKKLDVAALEQV